MSNVKGKCTTSNNQLKNKEPIKLSSLLKKICENHLGNKEVIGF